MKEGGSGSRKRVCVVVWEGVSDLDVNEDAHLRTFGGESEPRRGIGCEKGRPRESKAGVVLRVEREARGCKQTRRN